MALIQKVKLTQCTSLFPFLSCDFTETLSITRSPQKLPVGIGQLAFALLLRWCLFPLLFPLMRSVGLND